MGLKNSYAKGRKAEIEYEKTLELEGYKVISAPKGNKFTAQKDLFGYWDIVGFNNDHWLVVQVKSGTSNLRISFYKEKALELPGSTRCLLAHRKLDKSRRVKWRVIDLKA